MFVKDTPKIIKGKKYISSAIGKNVRQPGKKYPSFVTSAMITNLPELEKEKIRHALGKNKISLDIDKISLLCIRGHLFLCYLSYNVWHEFKKQAKEFWDARHKKSRAIDKQESWNEIWEILKEIHVGTIDLGCVKTTREDFNLK